MNDLAPAKTERRDLVSSGHEVLSTLQREMDRLFDDVGRGINRLATNISPRMDVSETDKTIDIEVELPGMEERDVEVSLDNDVLTISGEKKSEAEHKERGYWFVERSYGRFSRRLQVPAGIDPKSVKATMAKGVLSISLARPATAAATKIPVKPAN